MTFRDIYNQAKLNELSGLYGNDYTFASTRGMSYKDFKREMKYRGLKASDRGAKQFFYKRLDEDLIPETGSDETIGRALLPAYLEEKVSLPLPTQFTPWLTGKIPLLTGRVHTLLVSEPQSNTPSVVGAEPLESFTNFNEETTSRPGYVSEPQSNTPSVVRALQATNETPAVSKSTYLEGYAYNPFTRTYTYGGFWGSPERLSRVSRIWNNFKRLLTDQQYRQSFHLKRGGAIKYQQGGKMSDEQLQEAFMQFLMQKSGAKSEQELKLYVQSLGEDGLQQAYAEFTQYMQQQAQRAARGAKLQYLKKLKNQCADDEQLVYFKKGGSVECGCVKKHLDGAKVEEKNDIVKEFKAIRAKSGIKTPQQKPVVHETDTVHVKGKPYTLTNSDGSSVNPSLKYPLYKGKVEEEDRKKAKAGDKDAQRRLEKRDIMESDKSGGKVKKNCVGGFVKKGRVTMAKGGKCPKCGKVHSGPCKHKDGGQMGGGSSIDKYLEGGITLPTAQRASIRYKNARGKKYGSNGVTIQEIFNPNTRASIELSVLGKDSIIRETPPHSWYVTPHQRVVSNNYSYNVLGPDKDWDIMKRRWNEAKQVMNRVPYHSELNGTYPLPD